MNRMRAATRLLGLVAVLALSVTGWRHPPVVAQVASPGNEFVPSATSLAVTNISPNYGPASGGTRVTFTGSGFSTAPGATQFFAGSLQFLDVSCSSSTQCTATSPSVNLPAGAVGTGEPIQVTVGGQNATNQALFFVWYGTPQLSSVQPSSGPAAGGTVVQLEGSVFPCCGSLPGPVEVRFGTAPATDVSCNDNGCTATSPPGSGTVQVTVVTPGGVSNGVPFVYTTGGSASRPRSVLPLTNSLVGSVSTGERLLLDVSSRFAVGERVEICASTGDGPATLSARWLPRGAQVGIFERGDRFLGPLTRRCIETVVADAWIEFASVRGKWLVTIASPRR